MKHTIILLHTPTNKFDGWSPHRHLTLLEIGYDEYLKISKGNPFSKALAPYCIDPKELFEKEKVIGFKFKQPTKYNFYFFGNLHDGIDVDPYFKLDSRFKLKESGKTRLENINKYKTSFEIFELISPDKPSFRLGDKVKVKPGSRYVNGQKVADYVLNRYNVIEQINKDKILIKYNGTLVGWVYKKDLI